MRRPLGLLLAALLAAPLPASAACQAGATVCVDHNAARVSVVVGDDGSVEVWRGGDSLVDDASCLPERVVYALDESQSDLWYDCWREPHRIV